MKINKRSKSSFAKKFVPNVSINWSHGIVEWAYLAWIWHVYGNFSGQFTLQQKLFWLKLNFNETPSTSEFGICWNRRKNCWNVVGFVILFKFLSPFACIYCLNGLLLKMLWIYLVKSLEHVGIYRNLLEYRNTGRNLRAYLKWVLDAKASSSRLIKDSKGKEVFME